MDYEPSDEFVTAIDVAVGVLRYHQDSAIAYAIQNVPIYAQRQPTPEQRRAGGCPNCTYLGLWANYWPGYPQTEHGLIWLFEDGIRRMRTDLYDQVAATLIHEIEHALQRDHILQRVNPRQPAAVLRAYSVRIAPCLKRPC